MVSKVGDCTIVEWATFQWFTVKSPFFLMKVLKSLKMSWIGVDLNEKALKAFIFSGCVGEKSGLLTVPEKTLLYPAYAAKSYFYIAAVFAA